MTHRERFNAAMQFQPVDRCPVWHIGQWDETLERWHAEGLPEDVRDVREYLGYDYRAGMGLNVDLDPPFDAVVLEEDDRTRVVRRSDGAVVRAFKEGAGKSMPQWLDWPVTTRSDWEELTERLQPGSPGRLPADLEASKVVWSERDWPLRIEAGSLYGNLRQWIGVENLSLLFHDDPASVGEMMDHLADLYVGILDRALPHVAPRPDFAAFWEDLCYKNGPLVSPRQVAEMMVPNYKKITTVLRDHGIRAIFVDSDGNIEPLIPLWLEGGVNGYNPLEVASGMDPVALRKQYGDRVLLRGGIDKRALAAGGDALRDEVMSKVPFLARSGGYIPYVDHDTPPDVPWAHFREYTQQVMEAA
jgi:uroporphyrinogen decarboxylase